jgi:radical SAM protein (TIGR01212 family)
MLYIQAYTGTFTSVIKQKESYSKLLELYNFKAISIGTRPDCLNKSTLEYLQELNKQIDVYVDLGVQTLNDKTLKDINRGHDSKQTIKAIKDLKKYGIKIFAHIIVGFKNESRKDWLNSVKTLCKENIDGIKIHNLHIIKNTALEKEYEKEVFKTFNEYEYAEELIFLIRNIPSNIPIVRTSTDTPKCDLIAPIWNMQKGQFVEFINESMLYRGFKQGDLIEKKELILTKQNCFELEDGSVTIWDKIYKDYYHPKNGAYVQAKKLFLEQSKLKEELQEKDIFLLDIGFGMGINSLMAIKLEKKFKLDITALDKNKVIIKHSEILNKNKEEKEILKSLYENYEYKNSNNHIKLLIGDARFTITKLDKKFDIVFLDPFLPNLNPSLLSFDFIMLIKKVLKKSGIIICSQNNELIRNAFAKVGFTYKEFELEKTDIKGLILTLGNSFFKDNYYQDPYLIFREKQIITNFEQNK